MDIIKSPAEIDSLFKEGRRARRPTMIVLCRPTRGPYERPWPARGARGPAMTWRWSPPARRPQPHLSPWTKTSCAPLKNSGPPDEVAQGGRGGADKGVPEDDIPSSPGALQVHAHVLGLCNHRHRTVWCRERRMAGHEAPQPVPSVEPWRTRPRSGGGGHTRLLTGAAAWRCRVRGGF